MSKMDYSHRVLRAFKLYNYSGGTYIIQGSNAVYNNGWFIIVRLYRQQTSIVSQTYLKVGNPLLYYDSNFDIYVDAGNFQYTRIVVVSIEDGSTNLLFDNFNADVSQMTALTL